MIKKRVIIGGFVIFSILLLSIIPISTAAGIFPDPEEFSGIKEKLNIESPFPDVPTPMFRLIISLIIITFTAGVFGYIHSNVGCLITAIVAAACYYVGYLPVPFVSIVIVVGFSIFVFFGLEIRRARVS